MAQQASTSNGYHEQQAESGGDATAREHQDAKDANVYRRGTHQLCLESGLPSDRGESAHNCDNQITRADDGEQERLPAAAEQRH